MKQVLTLTFLLKGDVICLAQKKRGFGEGYWNGLGGKVETNETIPQAAVREVCEESGADVAKDDLEKVAIIEFLFPNGRHLEVHTFFARVWKGEPHETDEMKPAWFTYDEIPYEKMWADDPHWLPRVLNGEKLIGKVWFTENEKDIERMEWKEVESI